MVNYNILFIVIKQGSGTHGYDSRARRALLITAYGSFIDKHNRKKDLRTQDFKTEDPFLRVYYVFTTKIEKSESDSR